MTYTTTDISITRIYNTYQNPA